MKLLLFGKTGQLGWELQRTLAPLGKVDAFGPDELDLMDMRALERLILDLKPNLILMRQPTPQWIAPKKSTMWRCASMPRFPV